MSSAVVSTSAALGRPFVFDADATPEVDCHSEWSGKYAKRTSRGVEGPLHSIDSRLASVTLASQLEVRPGPEMASSGVPALDALTGGLPRGCLTEICGPASSGRTTILLAALSAATRRGEYCVVVDASDALDPHSAVAAGVDLDHLLWVRCNNDVPQSAGASPMSRTLRQGRSFDSLSQHPSHGRPARAESFAAGVGISSQSAFDFNLTRSKENTRPSEHRLEQVLRATDLLLESGGFGLIILDLADLPPQAARRVPLTTWFRFRRAVENKPTILLSIEQQPIAGSCSSLLLQLEAAKRRQNAAHGTSCELSVKGQLAPEDRKKINDGKQSFLDHESGSPAHAQLLTGLDINAELIRSRLDRKPAHSVTFATKTAWAG